MTKRDAQTNDPRPEMSCPHCDGEELELFSGEYEPGDPFWYVACLECGAEGPHGETPEDACKLWDAKHGRHRIGVRYTQPMCADAAACAAAPATATPAEIEKERARKQRFYDLAGGLLKPGA